MARPWRSHPFPPRTKRRRSQSSHFSFPAGTPSVSPCPVRAQIASGPTQPSRKKYPKPTSFASCHRRPARLTRAKPATPAGLHAGARPKMLCPLTSPGSCFRLVRPASTTCRLCPDTQCRSIPWRSHNPIRRPSLPWRSLPMSASLSVAQAGPSTVRAAAINPCALCSIRISPTISWSFPSPTLPPRFFLPSWCPRGRRPSSPVTST